MKTGRLPYARLFYLFLQLIKELLASLLGFGGWGEGARSERGATQKEEQESGEEKRSKAGLRFLT